MEKRKMRVAIIGQGRSGRDIHGVNFKNGLSDIIEVVYVVEYDKERRERAEKEYPGCIGLSDVTELCERGGVDLVVNASYSDEHYSITLKLLESGFNVVCEKPLARTRLECDTLIALAKEKGLTLAVFQQTNLSPIYVETKKLLERGVLGDIKQISLRYNGFSRRWDWQTLLQRCAGSVYNTGPHPIGIALGLLDFDPQAKVVFSRLDTALTSGDGEDYAKIIIEAPDKPVVDIEINSTDPFSNYNLKIQGSLGCYRCTTSHWELKYFKKEENPERPVIFTSLSNEEGYPAYCSEQLITHTEEGDFEGSAFDLAVERFYHAVYDKIFFGKEMPVTAEMAAEIISVIETVHAQNPLPLKYWREY